MAKNKTEGKTSPMQWVIRILILVIFVVAVAIAARNFMEANQYRRRIEEQEKKIEELQQQIDGMQQPEGEE